MDNYKEKIKKLLALAGSNNEHEARAAILKAREIMGRYKLTEADLEEKEKSCFCDDTGWHNECRMELAEKFAFVT